MKQWSVFFFFSSEQNNMISKFENEFFITVFENSVWRRIPYTERTDFTKWKNFDFFHHMDSMKIRSA